MIKGFNALLENKQPAGIKLSSTHMRSDHGAFCLWKAPSVNELENFFHKWGSTLLKATERARKRSLPQLSTSFLFSR